MDGFGAMFFDGSRGQYGVYEMTNIVAQPTFSGAKSSVYAEIGVRMRQPALELSRNSIVRLGEAI